MSDKILTIGDYVTLLAHRMPHPNLFLGAHREQVDVLSGLFEIIRSYAFSPNRFHKSPNAEQTARINNAIYAAANKAVALWKPWLVVSNATGPTNDALRELAHTLREVLRLIDRFDLLPAGDLRNRLIVALGGKAEG